MAAAGKRDFNTEFMEALEHHRAGRLKKAEIGYRAALKQQPEEPAVLSNLGATLVAQGNLKQAAMVLEKALKFNPLNTDALNNYAALLFARGEYSAAEEYYRRVLAQQADEPRALYNLANVLQQQGHMAEALKLYRRSLYLNPGNVEAHLNLAINCLKLGLAEEAIQHFQRVLMADRSFPGVSAMMMDAYRDLGRLAEAVRSGEKALAVNPGDVDVLLSYGLTLHEMGRLEEAAAKYEQARTLAPKNVTALIYAGNIQLELGRTAAAIGCYEQALKLEAHNPNAARNLRRALRRYVPGWHFAMLADTRRNAAYQQALEKAVTAGARVLDIGTGSGLLAMMAARAGAEHVYACEALPPLADTARQIVRDNGLADNITVINKHSAALEIGMDMPQAADVLVSEILDAGCLGEGVLPTLRHAREKLLTPDARIIPAAARIKGMLLSLPEARRVHPVRTISGFDLSAFDRFRVPGEYTAMDIRHAVHTPLSAEFDILALDFRALPPPASYEHPNTSVLNVPITAGGTLHALAFWFDLHLDKETCVSSRPGGELVHWGQAVWFFEQDMPVQAGTHVRLSVLQSERHLCFTAETAAG